MEICLAAWHYPHRTTLENAAYFLTHGYRTVSLLGFHFSAVLNTDGEGEALAGILETHDGMITVHGKLPASHEQGVVDAFYQDIEKIAAWQAKYRRISVLSFDVHDEIRDNIRPYLDFVLSHVENTRIAIEDFGLHEGERKQIETLRNNPHFGYLIDIGHMNIRLRGEDKTGYTLFTNFPEECPKTLNPGREEFIKAFRCKDFPIFEVHLHNNDGVKDWHWFLEDGVLDMHIIADTLKAIDYQGIVTIESAPGCMFPCSGDEADTRIANTRDYWLTVYSET